MWFLSLLFLVIAAVTVFGLVGYVCSALARRGEGRVEPTMALRTLAALSGAAAVAVYAWGLLHVAGSLMEAEDGGTDSAPARPCRTSGWLERHERGIEISGYSVSYVPLGFVCETSDGGTYDVVPGYVNPAAVGFALAGAGCAVSAGYVTELRARGRARRARAER
ncbi:hypothetical protein ACFV0T_06230 [Streptomyces sp. NPDC059582]|uniref:hypothetical protein n=1 Tax=Streptomyces sp. NPDC059582 TaxID=3346875 RepID=UPI0036825698